VEGGEGTHGETPFSAFQAAAFSASQVSAIESADGRASAPVDSSRRVAAATVAAIVLEEVVGWGLLRWYKKI